MAARGAKRIGAAKAAGLALVVLVPLIGFAVHLIADRPLAQALTLLETVELALVFAGVPSAVVFSSIGARLGAQGCQHTIRRALRIGASKGALTGLGLGLLVAIPAGALAHSVAGWLPLLLVSSALSAGAGAAAAAWIYRGAAARGAKAPT